MKEFIISLAFRAKRLYRDKVEDTAVNIVLCTTYSRVKNIAHPGKSSNIIIIPCNQINPLSSA